MPDRTVLSLPFVDDPGTLSDPALPLLFYDAPLAASDIGGEADIPQVSVRLVFR